ncbi:MAG: hypothetical protein WCT50_03965 [Patescibacteria group bacterium]
MLKDKNEPDLNSYNNLGGVSLREMNLGLWLSEHRKSIAKSITIFLIILCASLFIYSSYGYVIYFMSGKIDNQEELQVMSPRNVVTPMVIAPVEIFSNNENSDLAIRLKNPNDNFSAEFEYCLRQGETDITCGRSFIFPSEDKYLLALAIPLNLASSTPTFVVKDIFWSRINRREIPDWPAYLAERINFDITDIKFLGILKSGLSENIKLNSLEFTATNNTPFAYYEVPFDIFLYSGSRLIGVERHVASNFMAGEIRNIKISLAGDFGNVSRIEVSPRINIKDESVYLKYQGENK